MFTPIEVGSYTMARSAGGRPEIRLDFHRGLAKLRRTAMVRDATVCLVDVLRQIGTGDFEFSRAELQHGLVVHAMGGRDCVIATWRAEPRDKGYELVVDYELAGESMPASSPTSAVIRIGK